MFGMLNGALPTEPICALFNAKRIGLGLESSRIETVLQRVNVVERFQLEKLFAPTTITQLENFVDGCVITVTSQSRT